MKELVAYLAQLLVNNFKEVEINEIQGESTLVIELKVPQDEVGRVIGREGKTAWAIRTILASAGAKSKKKVVLEIIPK
ncbi:MAG: KH domain-containing protein [bacterium]|nr:KH domain-containing protein [bacterium]